MTQHSRASIDLDGHGLGLEGVLSYPCMSSVYSSSAWPGRARFAPAQS